MDIHYSVCKGIFVAPTLYKTSAPGTLMVLGEHAVLQNKPAIVAAVNQRMSVCLKARSDRQIVIRSSLGSIQFHLEDCILQRPFQYMIASILLFKDTLHSGFELTVVSDFRSDVGLGSSAAVTVATLAVLHQFVYEGNVPDSVKLLEMAKAAILTVQGIGSGADVAASVYGGVVVYQQHAPYVLKHFLSSLPLVAIYCGYKTPTIDVIKQVHAMQQKYSAVFEKIYATIEQCVLEAIPTIEQQNWLRLGEIFNIHQGLMNALGVATPELNALIDYLNAFPTVLGAKISGSGMGDCVIGLGAINTSSRPESKKFSGELYIPLETSLKGVCYE